MAKRGPITSCYECAGIASCYGSKQPGIQREEGRRRAAQCALPQKGRTTEVVRVVGRDRGMSRKNAQEVVEAGAAVWEGPSLVRLVAPQRRPAGRPPGGPAGQAPSGPASRG